MEERLQKIISAYGIASRRAAEKLISECKVTINGKVASIGDKADPEIDEVIINGEKIPFKKKNIYIALNKPKGYITTASDDRGRKTVMDLLDFNVRVYPIGRLDMDSSGLLLLTNDGDFANKITHPSSEKEKTYSVKVKGNAEKALPFLSTPMEIDGYKIRPAKVSMLYSDSSGTTLSFTIHEGRNRQIRKMCALAGLEVLSLKRISIGSVTLNGLESGKWRYLTDAEIASFKEHG